MTLVYRSLVAAAVVLSLLVVTLLLWKLEQLNKMIGWWMGHEPPSASSNITITELHSMGNLVVLKMHTADVLHAKGGGYDGMWIVSGDALLAVDMQQVNVVERNDGSRTILLPPPKVLSARVNHERTKTYDVKRATWAAILWGKPDVMRDHAMHHAQKMIRHAAEQDDVLAEAKANAETQIRTLFDRMGIYIDVKWKDSQSDDGKSAMDFGYNPAFRCRALAAASEWRCTSTDGKEGICSTGTRSTSPAIRAVESRLSVAV